MEIRNLNSVKPYITKDGSEIFEIFHPDNSEVRNLSLAVAKVEAGKATKPHIHKKSEEIYYILKGKGRMHLEGESMEVRAGDCIFIPPEAKHWIENTAKEELVILCSSSPAYSHDDTEIVEV